MNGLDLIKELQEKGVDLVDIAAVIGTTNSAIRKSVAAKRPFHKYFNELLDLKMAFDKEGPALFDCLHRKNIVCHKLHRCEGCGWHPDEERRRKEERHAKNKYSFSRRHH